MIALYLEEFKNDSLVQSLYKGELTIPQFISSITEDKPYHLIEVYEGNTQVMSKKAMIPLQGRISPDLVKDIEQHYDIITGIYPELSIYIDFVRNKTKEGCSNCNKNSFKFNVINAICMMGGINRELDNLYPIFGKIFTDELKKTETQKGFDINKHLELLINSFISSQNKSSKPISAEMPLKSSETAQISILSPKPYQSKGGRQSCVQCICKHLSVSMVNMQESRLGYPLHVWGCIGNMSEAESEAIDSFPELAKLIRQERIKIMEDNNYSPDFYELIRKTLGYN